MDQRSVPTLLEIAAKSLMSNEPGGIHALQVLPKQIFIQLFTTAFLGRHKNMLKEIVKVWPFQCLHIGTLDIEESPYDILEALVDGLQFLPTQNSSSGGSKLRILDLTQSSHHGITCYYRAKYQFCFRSCIYSQHSILKLEESQDRVRCLGKGASESESVSARKRIELLVDISFSCTMRIKQFISFLKTKVEQSAGSLHICCRKLQIDTMCVHTRSLQFLDAACINHLEVNRVHLKNVISLFPHLTHLEIIKLTAIPLHSCEGRNFNFFLTWLGKLEILQELSLSSFSLTDQLHRLLRVLKPRLTTLSLSLCHLSKSDIIVLSQSFQATCLKQLNLSNNKIFRDDYEPFLTLLERVSSTLQHLEINNCKMTDSVLSALLPPLSRCSQLRVFSFAFNAISMPALINFLQHITTWMNLRYVIYPIPAHCYEHSNFHVCVNRQKLAEVQAQVKHILQVAKREDMYCSISRA
ncbi:melanoma antigen preferentially expressed in tumors-like [Sorex araneus]|uniref:melanoma antigen preferentially expressed in tumors-like n=1 Tax=Sorex araneus TaxID=42254 RepID=UPI000331847F|nr:melanoma antigen preferentially expressed in tumors-like [Sorex araneus]